MHSFHCYISWNIHRKKISVQFLFRLHIENMKIQTNFLVSFHHNHPEVFVQSQWQKNDKSYNFLIFRWILASLFIVTVSFSWYRAFCFNFFGFWWIQMTDWGIILCMISTTYGALLTTLYHDNTLQLHPQSVQYKIYWCLTTIATNLAFVITTFYYGLLYFRGV